MVAVADAADVRLKNTEVAGNIRTAKFVIEGRGADRTFLHDGERRRDAGRRAVGAGGLLARHHVGIVFPALSSAREMERGNREAAETGLRTAAAAGSAFVTDLTAGTGGSARERRNRGRMVMRLNLEDRVRQFVLFREVLSVGRILCRTRIETRDFGTLVNRGVIGVCRNCAFRVRLVGRADVAEKRLIYRLSIDHPGGVENLVAAVLGIRLREHHEFGVRRTAAFGFERLLQVIHFTVRKRETHFGVRAGELTVSLFRG